MIKYYLIKYLKIFEKCDFYQKNQENMIKSLDMIKYLKKIDFD